MVPDDQLQDPVGWGLAARRSELDALPGLEPLRALASASCAGSAAVLTYEALESVVRIPVNVDSDVGDGALEKLSVSYRVRGDGGSLPAPT